MVKLQKFKGKRKKWYTTQTLYWRGQAIKRDSEEYQALLDKAYTNMYNQSKSFYKALMATNGSLTHSMGKNNINQTVLTSREFCGRLMKLREYGEL